MIKTALIIVLLFLTNVTAYYAHGTSSTEFSGIYSDGNRVGFNKITFTEKGEVLIIDEYSKIKMVLLGDDNVMEVTSKYILDNGILKGFSFQMNSVGLSLEARGKRDGNTMFFKTFTASGEAEFSKEIINEPIVPSYINRWIVNQDLTAGKKYQINIFEPSMILMGSNLDDLKAEIEMLGKDKLELPDGKYDCYKYRVNFNNFVSNRWIAENSELLKDESSLGLVAIREKEDLLRDENLSRVDITEKTAISATKTLDNPRKLKRLEVKLSGLKSLDEFNLHDNHRQFLNNDVLIIKTEDISKYSEIEGISNKETIDEQYLLHTNLIQSDNENIINLSNNIIGKTTNPIDKVKLINSWVYNTLDKKPTISIPNALDVLRTKTGDCNEHSVLFAALSRAVEIPTKIILGIVYLNGKFYYHAWNEVFLGKWISVDTTLNQLPADASHIKFLEGDISRSAEIIKLVGKLNLQIIDAS